MYLCNVTGDDQPILQDLYSTVAHQYAEHWDELGLRLGLKEYDIANISVDNIHNPHRSVSCCKEVLQFWLQNASSPSWGKMDDAIKSLSGI